MSKTDVCDCHLSLPCCAAAEGGGLRETPEQVPLFLCFTLRSCFRRVLRSGFLEAVTMLCSDCLPARRAGRFLGKRSAYCSLLHCYESLAKSGLKNASFTIKQPVRCCRRTLVRRQRRSGCFRSGKVVATEFRVMPCEAVGCIAIKYIATRVFLRPMFILRMPNCT